jgi:hypothetical protein
MGTIKSFSALADLLHRAKAKQLSDDEDEPPADDEARDDAVAKKKKKKLKDAEDKKDEDEKDDEKKQDEAAAIAKKIIEAGAKRRGEIPIDNPSPVASEAARHAGTATYTTPVKDPAAMATAIIAAAKKARSRT